jgi:phage tail tube protein FII
MTLSELILLIHWEVQKSFNLVEELTKSGGAKDAVNIHLGMDKFELTIPISINERDLYYSSVNRIIEDERFRKFYYPLIIQSDKELKGKVKGISAKNKGKVLEVTVKSTVDDKSKTKERLGQMTITLTRIRS